MSALYPSGPATMNNASGTARFSGSGFVAVNPYFPGGELVYSDAALLGGANLNANFGANQPTLSGSITNLFGADYNDDIDQYSGTIQIRNGYIGDDLHNTITATYAGTVSGNGETISMSGTMDGIVLGNPRPLAIDILGDGTSTIGGY